MDVSEKLRKCGIVPVVVIENEKDAVPTAQALLAGGIDVMEITFRTACAEMTVGAGTVLNLEQGKKAVDAGAKFIVSPGLDEELVKWCVSENVAVTPGCVTPTEIMRALSLGLSVVKFFPANIYGGLGAMKALSAPFKTVKFIPTGGVNGENIGEYVSAPFVFAVGGSWVCTKADIAANNFDKITELSTAAVSKIDRENR